MRVPRSVKDRYLELREAVEQLTHSLGRSPTLEEIAQQAQLTLDEVVEAFDAGMNYRPASLAGPSENGEADASEGLALGAEDAELLGADSRAILHAGLAKLSGRERRVLYLRFFEDMTQAEIAEQIGVSQVHVSRLLRGSLTRLRSELVTTAPGSDLTDRGE
jgi:RNA polymerase sigma-B factor